MMKICSYIHPIRSLLPCSGVGRHMNGILSVLDAREDVGLRLLYSRQWLQGDGRLPENSPQRTLPATTFRMPENLQERCWKLCGGPSIDRWVDDADFVYCPAETYLPLKRVAWGATIHDVHPFEDNLPWSRSAVIRRRRRKWSRWLPRTLRDARLVFTVSEFSKRRMVELLGADERKIVVTGNALDPAFLDAAGTQSRESSDRPYLIVVGGLTFEKGAEHVIEAARELSSRAIDCSIRVVGTSQPAWGRKAAGCGNVDELGRLDDGPMMRQIAGATALLFLSPYEGFGIPVLEAMVLGTPVIAANDASLPEVVGEHGWLVDRQQTPMIVDLVESLIKHPPPKVHLQNAREHARSYTWEACADRLVTAVRENA